MHLSQVRSTRRAARVRNTPHGVLGTQDFVLGTQDFVQGTQDFVQGTQDFVQGTRYFVRGTKRFVDSRSAAYQQPGLGTESHASIGAICQCLRLNWRLLLAGRGGLG